MYSVRGSEHCKVREKGMERYRNNGIYLYIERCNNMDNDMEKESVREK